MITPIFFVHEECKKNKEWRPEYFESVNKSLDEMSSSVKSGKLVEITEVIFEKKSEILGEMALGLIKENFQDELNQEYHDCSCCNKKLRKRDLVKRCLETKIGRIELCRPYFYCRDCKKGYYPFDEVLELASGVIQYDVQEVEAWLSSKMTYQEAQQAYKICTGNQVSTQHMFEVTNNVAESVDILDVSPFRYEINQKVMQLSEGKFRRPVLMIATDGAHAPTRAEPSPYKGKRGKGEWKESKGLRLYLLDSKHLVHLISWHQIQTDNQLTEALQKIKDAQLIPEKKLRICFIGDGAKWIWNKVAKIFPSAKQVLDFYHCSEYIHAFAKAQYRSQSSQAQEWVEATFTRLFHDNVYSIIWTLEETQPSSDQAKEELINLIRYLKNHSSKLHYGSAKKAGYHISSGAIESANKFIGHTRLKRSGAWWYPSCANHILALRCATYNGTFHRVFQLYKQRDLQKTFAKKCA